MTMQQQKPAPSRDSMDIVVGRNVHMLMWDRHMTQAQMGDVLGLEQSALGRKLRGKRGWSLDEVAAAAEFFGVAFAELCTPRDLNPEPTD
ncbi:helix-turn-helix transcriptional regulator [Humibacter ginsenosidimutans]|uniref:Helix-turn-helix transcriptional regulator n=1 Tax=Humibacter ginsenosidimutans TaxID=2599293 RepID=A0A5B8MAK0_9MICO|nr:helix-turn-helix transcriptional regulator [Humibacter ginsenosidimutans]